MRVKRQFSEMRWLSPLHSPIKVFRQVLLSTSFHLTRVHIQRIHHVVALQHASLQAISAGVVELARRRCDERGCVCDCASRACRCVSSGGSAWWARRRTPRHRECAGNTVLVSASVAAACGANALAAASSVPNFSRLRTLTPQAQSSVQWTETVFDVERDGARVCVLQDARSYRQPLTCFG